MVSLHKKSNPTDMIRFNQLKNDMKTYLTQNKDKKTYKNMKLMIFNKIKSNCCRNLAKAILQYLISQGNHQKEGGL